MDALRKIPGNENLSVQDWQARLRETWKGEFRESADLVTDTERVSVYSAFDEDRLMALIRDRGNPGSG